MPDNSLEPARQRLERQLHYLRGPLPPGPDVCTVCRGPKIKDKELCSRCTGHCTLVGTPHLADAVVPISYAFRSHPELNQHSWALWSYKKEVSYSPELKQRLIDLFQVFINAHARCIGNRFGGPPDWYTTVPSSDGRESHPLQDITRISNVSQLSPAINPAYSVRSRRFQIDAFHPFEPDLTGSKVLVIDDTWVTGNTAQALAHRLKLDGAATVMILTLGRWADWREPSWTPLIGRSIVSASAFDVKTCALDHT